MKYAIYDAKLGIYWDAVSLGLQRYHDSPSSAISDWESDTPPVTLQKQQISFYKPITNEWCVPEFYKQCRFFIHEVDVDSDYYKLVLHNEIECTYEHEVNNNKFGRTLNHQNICKKLGILPNDSDDTNPFIKNLHR